LILLTNSFSPSCQYVCRFFMPVCLSDHLVCLLACLPRCMYCCLFLSAYLACYLLNVFCHLCLITISSLRFQFYLFDYMTVPAYVVKFVPPRLLSVSSYLSFPFSVLYPTPPPLMSFLYITRTRPIYNVILDLLCPVKGSEPRNDFLL
jgi:hypothetical protein